jgi:hypothetical protein
MSKTINFEITRESNGYSSLWVHREGQRIRVYTGKDEITHVVRAGLIEGIEATGATAVSLSPHWQWEFNK